MIAIRQIQEVTSGTITIQLPIDFSAKKVEIIILPIEESMGETSGLEEILLSGPTLTDEELQEYEAVKDWMNQWNVSNF